MNYFRTTACFLFLVVASPVQALTIVHMETQIGVDTSELFIELYDEVAPANVANFVGYVNRGDYDNSFFHRKVQTFIVQGGGFTYNPVFDFDAHFFRQFGVGECDNLVEAFDPVAGELGLRPIDEIYVLDFDGDDCAEVDVNGDVIARINDGLQIVPVGPLPVVGEPSLSNLRGTIAGALFSDANGDPLPDSTETQWFVNIKDNLTLDPAPVGSGFTVFGKVLGTGMDFFDLIDETLPTNQFAQNIHPELGELPVVNHEDLTLVLRDNLVRLNTASEVLNIDITDHDFGFVDVNQTAQVVITLTASTQWLPDIVVSAVGDLELLDPPMSETNDCTLIPISSGNSCQITITYAPTVIGNFDDVLDIVFTGLAIPNIAINITGNSRTLPKVESSTGNTLDFEFVYPGIPEVQTFELSNLGQQTLLFNDLILGGTNVADYSFTHDCTALEFKEICTVEVTLTSPDEGLKTATLTIDSNEPTSPFVISLTGEGSFDNFAEIDVQPDLDFGEVVVNGESFEVLTITNVGNEDLTFPDTSFVITGSDASEFTVATCTPAPVPPAAVPPENPPTNTCALTVTFNPITAGLKGAVLEINTNDPVDPVVFVNLIATSNSDTDGVTDLEEDSIPNNGDGNNDDIVDKFQSNVVSMTGLSGTDVTLVTSAQLAFSNADIAVNPSPVDSPVDQGVVSYDLTGIPSGITNSLPVGLVLTTNNDVGTFYQFGPSLDNPVPHWYEFMYDGVTGAQVLNNVTMTSASGKSIERTFVRIWYADGKRGDNDLTVNGSITSVSTFSTTLRTNGDDSSGSLSSYLLLMFTLLLLLRLVLLKKQI